MTSSRGKLGVSQRYKEKVKKIAEREALVDRMNVMKNVLMQKICMVSSFVPSSYRAIICD